MLFYESRYRAIDANGLAIAGARLHTYQAGTSSTAKDTFYNVDCAVGHENANPVVADSGGLFGPIYLSGSYKFVLADADDIPIWSQDDAGNLLAADITYLEQTVEDKLSEFLSVKDFGAVGDGITDDTVAIYDAIQAASGTYSRKIYVPAGIYLVTQGFTITRPVRFIGEGSYGPKYNGEAVVNGSTIKYGGAPGATMFLFKNIDWGGVGMENLTIDCDSIAGQGLILEAVAGWTSSDLGIHNWTLRGLLLHAPGPVGTGGGETTSWCNFINTFITGGGASGVAALHLAGITGSNAAHCSFTNTNIEHVGAACGILLGGCDNISMTMTYIQRVSGSANGVLVDPTEATGFPIGNTFYHLETGAGGWSQPGTTVSSPASIYHYSKSNGEPDPVVNGTPLFRISESGQISGMKGIATGQGGSQGSNMLHAFTFPSGATTYDYAFVTAEADASYTIFLGPEANLPVWWITNKTVSGYRVNTNSAPGTNVYTNALMIR